MGRDLQRDGRGGAGPQDGGGPARAGDGDDIGVVPLLQLSALETGHVGGRDAVGAKGRAAAAVGAHQAKRFWVGRQVGGGVYHLENADARGPARNAHGKALDDVGGLLVQGDGKEAAGRGHLGIEGWGGVGLDQPHRFVKAVLAHELVVEGGDAIDEIGLKVDVQRDGVAVIVIPRRAQVLYQRVQVAPKVQVASIGGVPPIAGARKDDAGGGVGLFDVQIGHALEL